MSKSTTRQFLFFFKDNTRVENYPPRHRPEKPAKNGGRIKHSGNLSWGRIMILGENIDPRYPHPHTHTHSDGPNIRQASQKKKRRNTEKYEGGAKEVKLEMRTSNFWFRCKEKFNSSDT